MLPDAITAFQKTVWDYYGAHRREMPWRQNVSPYFVVVSELMLQQTQVERVIPKFKQFVTLFPSVQALAVASQGEVLKAWVGLGYNRRAQYLHRAAQVVASEFGGHFPADLKRLTSLPGIGPNTAGAVLNYAFNMPTVFVETNIRTVFIHHFFDGQEAVDDAQVKELVATTLDLKNPREWFWALMDYGVYVKKTAGNNISRSRHYKKQSVFAGSLRQVRGRVVAHLAVSPATRAELHHQIADERLDQVLDRLSQEKLIIIRGNRVQLA